MKRIFCATCGTAVNEPAPCCPCCGRCVQWPEGDQPMAFLKKKKPTQPQGGEPETLFSEAGAKQELAASEYEEAAAPEIPTAPAEPCGPKYRPQPVYGQGSQKRQASAERSDALRFGDALLLALCTLLPVVGTIVLSFAAYAGAEPGRNRRTLAKALLAAHVVVCILLTAAVLVLAPIVQYWLYY